MKSNNVRGMTEAAVIAALYAVLTLCFAPLSYGPVQFRISEALTILPILTPTAVPGLVLGCLVSNILGMSTGVTLPIDIFFGTAATLAAAVVTRLARNAVKIGNVPVISLISPVFFNGIIVGAELSIFFGAGTFVYCAAAVSLGELAAVGTLGVLLLTSLEKTKLFNTEKKEN